MSLTESIASLHRAIEHNSHLLEDWSRGWENYVMDNLTFRFRNPRAEPPAPDIAQLDQSSRVLWRLTAVVKTLDTFAPSSVATPRPTEPPSPDSAVPPASDIHHSSFISHCLFFISHFSF